MNTLESSRFITHLAIMLMPGLLLSQLISAMAITIMPATSAYDATKNQKMLRELLVRGMRYISIFALAIVLVAFPLMKPVFELWVGTDYIFLAPYAMALLAGTAFMEVTSVAHHMLKGIGKLKEVVYIYFIGLVAAPACILLVVFHWTHDPYLSVCLGLTAGNLLTGILQVTTCSRLVNAGFNDTVRLVYAQPLGLAATIGVIAFYTESKIVVGHFITHAAISATALMLFLAGCYLFIASPEERRWIGGILTFVQRKIVFLFAKFSPKENRS